MSTTAPVKIDTAPSRIAGGSGRGIAGARKELGILGLLLLICFAAYRENNVFFSADNLSNMANLIGIYGIYSIGAGIVIATGGIDLTVGSVFAFEGVLVALALNNWHWGATQTVLAALAFTMGLGLINGLLITKIPLQPFIVTLCGLLIYRGLARVTTQDQTVGFGDDAHYHQLTLLTTGSKFIGIHQGQIPFLPHLGFGFEAPYTLFMLIGISIVMWVLLHRSVYGRHLFAVGRNEEAARYSGINSNRVTIAAYVLAGLMTGIAGILLAFYTTSISPSSQGQSYELYGIAAAVLGGCSLRGGEGSVIGILIGTILLQVLQNLVTILGIPDAADFSVVGSVILLGVLFDQLAKRGTTKRQDIIAGIAWFAAGIAGYFVTHKYAPEHGGYYVIAWSAIAFGAYLFIKGAVLRKDQVPVQ